MPSRRNCCCGGWYRDLIVVDIALPGMDGLTLTRLLKGDPRLAHVPVVALTAFVKRATMSARPRRDASAISPKPIDTKSFAEDIAETLAASVARRRKELLPGGLSGRGRPFGARDLQRLVQCRTQVLRPQHRGDAMPVHVRAQIRLTRPKITRTPLRSQSPRADRGWSARPNNRYP